MSVQEVILVFLFNNFGENEKIQWKVLRGRGVERTGGDREKNSHEQFPFDCHFFVFLW